jgi:phosphoribosylanthranilate isomerase
MTRIKVCGITNREDAEIAATCGVDAIGFVFAESPRRVAPEHARELLRGLDPFLVGVGVFVNSPVEEVRRVLELTGCSVAQLHGDEGPEYVEELAPYGVVKVVRVPRRGEDGAGVRREWAHPPHSCTVLLDTLVPEKMGGTGERFDLSVAEEMVREGYRVIVAGGLTAENVGEVVTRVRPYGVDVSSGVEVAPGRKDHQKVREFVEAVRVSDQETAP